ncbi:hypothetical protein ACTFZI_26090, partial [Klebsiella pneumoniae]
SGAFLVVFGVLATTFCPSAIRNALSASGAVRVRDVMFNVDNRSKSDAYIYWCSGSRRYCI